MKRFDIKQNECSYLRIFWNNHLVKKMLKTIKLRAEREVGRTDFEIAIKSFDQTFLKTEGRKLLKFVYSPVKVSFWKTEVGK